MQTRKLGASNIEVSCIGLGAMPLSIANRPSEAQALAVVRAAIEAGMTLIDTADVYCLDDSDIGHNERLIAKALRDMGSPANITIATKGGLRRPGGSWTTDGRPAHLKAACDASRRALGTDCIDLYQLHAPDDDVPFADSVQALAELQASGAIRHVGLSNVTTAEIEQARSIVDIVSVQNRCNIFDTKAFDEGVVDYCDRHGIAFMAHSPVGGHRGHARLKDAGTVNAIANRLGATAYQVVLAWLLAQSTLMIPIPGASRVASAQSSAAAADLELSAPDLRALSQLAAPSVPNEPSI